MLNSNSVAFVYFAYMKFAVEVEPKSALLWFLPYAQGTHRNIFALWLTVWEQINAEFNKKKNMS